MSRATCKSELPNPQKALTKLTKAPLTTPFVSFVSAFLCPQISKTGVLPPSRPAELSFTHQFFDYRQAHGRTRCRPLDMMRARKTSYSANATRKCPAL
jgi:hypothetical protein